MHIICQQHPDQKEYIKQITTEGKILPNGQLKTGDLTITTRIICPRCDDLLYIEVEYKNRRRK